MSTKATIAYGPNFHLYHEVLDEDYVYLELEGVQFEASYNRVLVPIPIHIWEVIRQYPGIDLAFADKTADEIRGYVEQQVDERLTHYREANQSAKGLIALSRSLSTATQMRRVSNRSRQASPTLPGCVNTNSKLRTRSASLYR